MPKKAESEFRAMLDKMAASVLRSVKRDVKKKKWNSAFVDIRAQQQAVSWISKLRVEMANGTLLRTLDEPDDLDVLFFAHLWKVRSEAFTKPWFGLKLTVVPSGEYDVEYNYDPDCRNDPTFFDVDPG